MGGKGGRRLPHPAKATIAARQIDTKASLGELEYRRNRDEREGTVDDRGMVPRVARRLRVFTEYTG